MDPLFCQRLRVGMADKLTTMPAERFSAAVLALGPLSDIPALERPALSKALEAGDGRELLRLFWSVYAPGLLLNPTHCRLLVNPPAGLARINAEDVCTLTTSGTLGGSYGDKLPLNNLDFWIMARERESKPEYVDDITIFYDEAVDLLPLLDKAIILPGSTLTFVRPNPDNHRFWVAWSNLKLGGEHVLQALESRYWLRHIYEGTLGEVNLLILGVEAHTPDAV